MSTPQAKRRALVAEDDRALADVIRLALTRAGFDVTVTFDGQKALQAANAAPYDLIVSDYQMPLINGEVLLSSIRNSSVSRNAAMILCSAKSYELNSERLRGELGLAEIFYKPFSLRELILIANQSSIPTLANVSVDAVSVDAGSTVLN